MSTGSDRWDFILIISLLNLITLLLVVEGIRVMVLPFLPKLKKREPKPKALPKATIVKNPKEKS